MIIDKEILTKGIQASHLIELLKKVDPNYWIVCNEVKNLAILTLHKEYVGYIDFQADKVEFSLTK